MKKYQDMGNGTIQTDKGRVPAVEANSDYRRLQQEVADGEAEILPYVEPAKPARQVRDEALEAMVYDFGDGRVIQVRPKDEANFKRAYRIFALTGVPTIDWVMVDNTKHPVTEAELRTAEDDGLLQGAAIWDAYDPEA